MCSFILPSLVCLSCYLALVGVDDQELKILRQKYIFKICVSRTLLIMHVKCLQVYTLSFTCRQIYAFYCKITKLLANLQVQV